MAMSTLTFHFSTHSCETLISYLAEQLLNVNLSRVRLLFIDLLCGEEPTMVCPVCIPSTAQRCQDTPIGHATSYSTDQCKLYL